MSKKAPAKKGAAPPPEPVPVVEEPPKPSPEELAALAKVEEERRIREHNVARVTFPKLPIKRIVSHHSSTILATEAPVVVALADVKENEVRIAFRHRAGERGYIVASEVAETVAPLLHFRVEELGDERFAQIVARLRGLVPPFLPPALQAPAPSDPAVPSLPAAPAAPAAETTAAVDGAVPPAEAPPAEPPLSEAAFVDVFARLFAPSFHFGQQLRLYAGRNCATEVRELLLRGCAINTANGEGLTALHFACEKDHVAVVDALLAAHVDGHPLLQLDLNAQDKHGWTPLHCAVHHGAAACLQRLLALRPQSAALAAFAGLRGVDASLRTRLGHGPLHVACAQNRGTFVQPLLDAGARFSDTDALGRTPLHLAAYHGHASLFAEYAAALGGKAPQLAADAEALTLPDALRFAPADYVAIDETPKIFV